MQNDYEVNLCKKHSFSAKSLTFIMRYQMKRILKRTNGVKTTKLYMNTQEQIKTSQPEPKRSEMQELHSSFWK